MKLKNIGIILICILLGIFILTNPETVANGVKNGLLTCFNSVIPALYPFTVLCLFIIKSNIYFKSKLLRLIFSLDGAAGTVCILSLISGYPVGARLIDELYLNKTIDKNTAEYMLCFCINPGPAFIIGIIGYGIYNNLNIGVIILASEILSSIIMCQLAKLKFKKPNYKIVAEQPDGLFISLCNSVNDANISMISICGWVIISSVIIACFGKYEKLLPIVCLSEVTNGAFISAEKYGILFVAFLIGFGGLCVHFQVLSASKNIKPKYLNIFISKTIQGFITLIFTFIILKIFPQQQEVMKLYKFKFSETSISAGVILFIFIILTLIFNYVKKSRKNQNYMLL